MQWKDEHWSRKNGDKPNHKSLIWTMLHFKVEKKGGRKREKGNTKKGKKKKKWNESNLKATTPILLISVREWRRGEKLGGCKWNSDNCPDIYRILRTIPDNNKVQQRREFWNPL